VITTERIARAVAVLKAGGVVAFPTETVYGLGANAASPQAIAKIYKLKGRPADHPVIVHVAALHQVARWAAEISPLAQRLAERFWPGPLTLIMRRALGVHDAITGGQDTVALRVPSHPVAHALLEAFAGGVAAPSANRFGRVSATTAAHVHEEFGAAVDLVLDGGACDVGIESTIVDVSGAHPALLRPGGISLAAIESALGEPLAIAGRAAPRAPGTLAAHYAPATPLMLVDTDVAPELARTLARQGKRTAVLSFSTLQPVLPGLTWIAASPDPAGYAHDLYTNLRQLDATHSDVIVIERPPEHPDWFAVLDRLTRAAAGSTALEKS